MANGFGNWGPPRENRATGTIPHLTQFSKKKKKTWLVKQWKDGYIHIVVWGWLWSFLQSLLTACCLKMGSGFFDIWIGLENTRLDWKWINVNQTDSLFFHKRPAFVHNTHNDAPSQFMQSRNTLRTITGAFNPPVVLLSFSQMMWCFHSNCSPNNNARRLSLRMNAQGVAIQIRLPFPLLCLLYLNAFAFSTSSLPPLPSNRCQAEIDSLRLCLPGTSIMEA